MKILKSPQASQKGYCDKESHEIASNITTIALRGKTFLPAYVLIKGGVAIWL